MKRTLTAIGITALLFTGAEVGLASTASAEPPRDPGPGFFCSTVHNFVRFDAQNHAGGDQISRTAQLSREECPPNRLDER
jgi:hypothetical protein